MYDVSLSLSLYIYIYIYIYMCFVSSRRNAIEQPKGAGLSTPKVATPSPPTKSFPIKSP